MEGDHLCQLPVQPSEANQPSVEWFINLKQPPSENDKHKNTQRKIELFLLFPFSTRRLLKINEIKQKKSKDKKKDEEPSRYFVCLFIHSFVHLLIIIFF